MDHNNTKINRLVLFGIEDKKNYVEMDVPEGWSTTINTYHDKYGGYGIPYTFKITNTSQDKSANISFSSPYYYVEDYLNNYNDLTIDDYNNLHRKFIPLKEFMERSLTYRYGKYENFKIDIFILSNNVEQARENRKKYVIDDLNKKNRNLCDHYYESGVMTCSYTYNQRNRKHVMFAREEAIDFVRWERVANTYYMDAYMLEMMANVYPNFQYDETNKCYIYTIEHQKDRSVENILEMDCLLEDCDFVYKQLFIPVLNAGVLIHDDIWNDYNKKQNELNEKKRKVREERKQVAEIERQAREDRRKRDKELNDYLRKNQQDISNMINSSYEYKKQVDNKISEQWSDVNRGNTRFVDKYGNEHVIHTYNDYAYKKGDDYVTSDSKLDIGYEWEELKKKKY